MNENKIRIEQKENILIGLLNDERIIVISLDDMKIGMSTTLPSNIEKAKVILFIMNKTIEEAENKKYKENNHAIS